MKGEIPSLLLPPPLICKSGSERETRYLQIPTPSPSAAFSSFSFSSYLWTIFFFKGGGCSYRHRGGQKLKTQNQVRGYGYDSGWDIEDLVKLGRQLKCCPYYASRDLMDSAHIVFSPYNYLIDPKVRQSMKIPLANNIIILDEAHNIEDSARESAGGSFSQEDFRLALNDCEKVSAN